jgi:hypothetical protein
MALVQVGSDGMATPYGLDGQRIECRWGRAFPQPSSTGPGVHATPIPGVPGHTQEESSWSVTLTSQTIADVEGRIELDLVSSP